MCINSKYTTEAKYHNRQGYHSNSIKVYVPSHPDHIKQSMMCVYIRTYVHTHLCMKFTYIHTAESTMMIDPWSKSGSVNTQGMSSPSDTLLGWWFTFRCTSVEAGLANWKAVVEHNHYHDAYFLCTHKVPWILDKNEYCFIKEWGVQLWLHKQRRHTHTSTLNKHTTITLVMYQYNVLDHGGCSIFTLGSPQEFSWENGFETHLLHSQKT